MTTRVWATLPNEIHEYFFRRVLAGEHRAKQELTRQFYLALYQECRRRNISDVWHVDNYQSIQQIMNKLNFNDGPQ